MSTERVFNFSAGPAILPYEVITKIRDDFMNYGGMSILEISHRSKPFENIIEEARNLVAELLRVPKNYKVLFLQGGARMQFAMVPMNLLDTSADYVITGYWSEGAAAEARAVGEVKEIFSSKSQSFSMVPAASEIRPTAGASYVHITTNNTIYGTQFHEIPDVGEIPLVADMSSDFMSKPMDVDKFGLIYAGAQKNAGPAGVTIVIARDDLIKRSYRKLPQMLKYSTHAEHGSMFNTPPVFAIYVLRFVMQWLKEKGGLSAIDEINREKAKIIYDVLDGSEFYKGNAARSSRSMMNVTFTLPDEELAKRFIDEAKAKKLVGLKGHRSVGGIRASIYNAFPIEGVRALAEFMVEFERKEVGR